MPPGLSPLHLLVVLVVALIVLGPEQLPGAVRQVGRVVGELRRWAAGVQTEMERALRVETLPPSAGADQIDDAVPAPLVLPAFSTPPPAPASEDGDDAEAAPGTHPSEQRHG